MKRLFFLLCLIPFLCFGQSDIPFHGRKLAYSDAACCYFNLPTNATTSAGVYLADSTLIRTLWTNQFYTSGQHQIFWDGKNDDGNAVATGNYNVKVLYHNIGFTWEGTLGACNNSDSTAGPSVFHYFSPIADMTRIVYGGTEYMDFGVPFSEGEAAQYRFATAHPRTSVQYRTNTTGQATLFKCSNNTKIFNGGKDYDGTNNFVFATDYPGTDLVFTHGQPEVPSNGITYPSTLDLNHNGPSALMRGMACTNKFLFVSRQDSILVYQVNDGSGLRVQSLLMTGAQSIANDGQNTLWVSYATSVVKYTINTNGSLTSAVTTITGFARPAALDVDTANTTLWILDGGNQQIVKKYTTSGSSVSTIGTAGGYATSPTITNLKFYIEDTRGALPTYVRHQSDGSIWIGDTGNKRNMHFSTSGTYIDNITYLPATYYCTAVVGQTDHIFAGFLEYTIDYTQPIATRATLIANWGYNYPSTFNGHPTQPDGQGLFSGIGMFSNGRRYGIGNMPTIGSFVFELTSTGFKAVIGSSVQQFSQLASDLSLNNFNGTPSFYKYPQAGYVNDGTGQPYPNWDTSTQVILSSPVIGTEYPNIGDRTFQTTPNGFQFMYDGAFDSTQKYALAGMNPTNNQYRWKALFGTPRSYAGDFPFNYFDRGNLVNFPGSDVKAAGNFIIAAYRGENWKNGQTSEFFVFYQNGLRIATPGVVWLQNVPGYNPAPKYATNILNIIPHYDGSDNVFWTINAENGHGLQSWKMSNTSSLAIQNVTYNYTVPTYPPAIPGSDLLAGVPNNSTLTVANGWTRVPSADNSVMTTLTRTHQIDSLKSPDIKVSINDNSLNTYISRSLPYNSSFPNWKVTGTLDLTGFFTGSENLAHEQDLISVYDSSGKAILSMHFMATGRIYVNGTYYGPVGPQYPSGPFEISKSGSNVFWSISVFGVTYSGTSTTTDGSANINAPAQVAFEFPFSGGIGNSSIDITTLRYLGL